MKYFVENMYTDVRVYSALSFQCFFFLIYTMSPATALTTALTHICAGKNARQ